MDVHRTVSNRFPLFRHPARLAASQREERYVGNVTSKCALEALPRTATLNAAVSLLEIVLHALPNVEYKRGRHRRESSQRDTAGSVEADQFVCSKRTPSLFLLLVAVSTVFEYRPIAALLASVRGS